MFVSSFKRHCFKTVHVVLTTSLYISNSDNQTNRQNDRQQRQTPVSPPKLGFGELQIKVKYKTVTTY